MARINEQSTITFTVVPINESGTAFTPTSARYRLDDSSSSTEIIAWTDVSSLSTSMDVVIPASANAIIDNNLPEEEKTFTFQTDYGTSNQHGDEVKYRVKNLSFVS